MDTLKALCKSAFRSILIGFVVITICCMNDEFHDGAEELFFMTLFLTALNFFLVFGFVVAFLIPLSRIEKKRIEEGQPVELLKRYLPVVVFPITILLFLIVKSEIRASTGPFFFAIGIGIITQFSIGLWTFLKSLKSTKK